MELIVTKVSSSIPAYFLYQLSFQVKLVQEEALVILLWSYNTVFGIVLYLILLTCV